SPHSCSWSRSPLRQWAAAKPSQVMKANRATNTTSAVQFTSSTAFPPVLVAMRGREIDDRGEHGSNNHPKKLVPVEEWEPDPGGFCPVVERRPQYGHELDQEEQVPPTPIGAILARLVHSPPRSAG